MKYRTGLKPVTRQPDLMLSRFYTSDLPTVDSLTFPLGYPDKIQPKMYLNNILGCCAWSGSFEETRLANALRDVTVNLTDKDLVTNYESTGYKMGPEIEGFNADGSAIINPAALSGDLDPNPTDEGTDVHALMDYRKNTGILSEDGPHQIIAYAGLTPGDWDEMLVALSQFFMVPIGVQVTDYCEQQFEAGQPWHIERGRHQIVGGHYVPVVGATDANTAQIYTWGAVGGIESDYYAAHNVVAVVALTKEMFTGDTDIAGVDFEKLAAELPEFDTGQVSAKAPRGKRLKAVDPE